MGETGVNMTLSAFAAELRRLLSIDLSCPWGAQQQTNLAAAVDQWDGRSTVS